MASENPISRLMELPSSRGHAPDNPIDAAAIAPKDPEEVDKSPHVPASLGRRRGSLKGAAELREAIRRASVDAASNVWKGSNKQLKTFLQKHTVVDLKLPSKVVEIDANLDPVVAFDSLLKANILSAPVWDKETKQYIGFLDIKDLVASTLHTAKNKVAADSFLTVAVGSHVGQNPSVKYLAKRNPFKPVKPTSTLLEVATLLHERHCHRVPVVDNGKCVAIVSQSSVISYLADHRDSIAEDVAQTLEDLKLGLKSVVTVNESSTARDAFAIIEKSNLSGIGVIDDDGKLVGNTSARDIKYFVLDKGQLSLEEPIMDYLATIRQGQTPVKDRAPVSTVRKTDTLSRAIGLLGKTQYHRLFVIDQSGKPIGVISVSDILIFSTMHDKSAKDKDDSPPSAKEPVKESPVKESPVKPSKE